MQTIFPILRYTDARAAIRWLCEAFGFREIFSVPETGQFVRHAQLSLGTSLIILGSCRNDEAGVKSPRTLGAVTQALYVYVPDVDAHFDRARLAGVEITTPPQDTGFSREYHVRDLEGHIWTFGTYLPNADAA
jgi:uncharacterized glyoxalase superfamily protein PhnB